MRVFRGMIEAKEFVAGRGAIPEDDVPEAVAQRIQSVFGKAMTPQEVVAYILARVRKEGDAAVRELTRRLDGVDLADLEVPQNTLVQALNGLSHELRGALQVAAERVTQFARASLSKTWHDEQTGLGEMIVPLERVGVYAPGGTAAYPSTVIMSAAVARAAGVNEVIMCTPSRDGVNPDPAVLAAAQIAGVDRVFRIGGAQALGAMAFGTASVPKVDKICGPGNIFIALAKQQLFGHVGIDGIFGPTETAVIADESADPALCAADLLGQAEHDVMAAPVFITTSESLLDRVGNEITAQLDGLTRRDIAAAALVGQGAFIVVASMDEAIEVANLIAPEHLCLNVQNPWQWAGAVRNAGGLFLGAHSAEVMGDYVAGPSHTLPTYGTARFASYLGVDQFIKRIPVVALSQADAQRLAPTAAVIAYAEGFTGHAKAAEMRGNK